MPASSARRQWVAFDASGNLYVSNFTARQILRFPAAGGNGIIFADASDGIREPDGLAFDADGNLFVANRDGFNILRVDPTGTVTVFDNSPCNPFSIVIRRNRDIYFACIGGNVFRYAGGDVSQRSLFGTYVTSGNLALQFSEDESVLYLTSFGRGDLQTINPDTGAAQEVLPVGSIAGGLSIAVFGR